MSSLTFRSAALSALLAASGLGLFLAGGEACATRECVPPPSPLYTAGDLIGSDAWESTPLDGVWFHYLPGVVERIEIPELAFREVVDIQVYLSPVFNPNALPPKGDLPNNFALASGNLAEIAQVLTTYGDIGGPNAGKQVLTLQVNNSTCAEYYARVYVVCAPAEAGAAAGDDAGDDAGDADTDATTAAAEVDAGDADAVPD